MYSKRPNLVLGFHGCDKKIADSIIQGDSFIHESTNDYDWLGHGIYFWENNLRRAFDFANEQKQRKGKNGRSKVEEPAVVGAIIDLGFCLDLLDSENLQIVKYSYKILKDLAEQNGFPMPENKGALRGGEDLLLRKLDCAVIENIHFLNANRGISSYDTVRGVFWEGDDLYPSAGFKEKNHIQICVRNPNCIKGFFKPLQLNLRYSRP